MKILMISGLAGPDVTVSGGDPYECSDEEAIRHIERGHAVPVLDAPREKAVKRAAAETR